jgi:hypothetical protein
MSILFTGYSLPNNVWDNFGVSEDIRQQQREAGISINEMRDLGVTIGEKQISTASDFAAEQMRMDIAVALLGFGRQEKEQVVDFMGQTKISDNGVGLASGNISNYVENKSNEYN